ncbi:hypothetical protein GCM10007036_19690 [Alsobacter metallidurans]|uniref:Carbohydrate kinase PfkB domain-containing protein n=1 Tax=Alsobacter metallidurans TaxID=340221 RepID=A0A917MHY6_9HYPH|nr:carbohydrate kinase family protein [Alsobacter metallidurans]GGH17886.1 hypothetical protein GCM10007036_19690 [Alsobacter metallidurans]
MTRRRAVLVVGYLSIDTIETPAGRFGPVPGGAALYAALGALAAEAVTPCVAAAVGDDYPAAWLEALAAKGVDLARVERRPGPSRTARITHAQDGARASPHHRDPQWWARTVALAPTIPADAGSFGAIAACPMPVERLEALLDAAGDARVLVDTSEAFAGADTARFLALAPRMSVLAASREETRLLLPDSDDEDAVIQLASLGCCVLQKRGREGAAAAMAGSSRLTQFGAPTGVEALDPTGAGDAVLGAMAAGLAGGSPFLDLIEGAMRVGGRAVSGRGPAGLGLDLSPTVAQSLAETA